MSTLRIKTWVLFFVLAAVSPVYGEATSITVEESYTSDGYKALEYDGVRYYEQSGGIRKKLDQFPASVNEVMNLSFKPTNKAYSHPTEIDGIVEDIPYNYYADMDKSSTYIYSLIQAGFELTGYFATSRVISLELERDGLVCRILVYENYLKVYMPRGGS